MKQFIFYLILFSGITVISCNKEKQREKKWSKQWRIFECQVSFAQNPSGNYNDQQYGYITLNKDKSGIFIKNSSSNFPFTWEATEDSIFINFTNIHWKCRIVDLSVDEANIQMEAKDSAVNMKWLIVPKR